MNVYREYQNYLTECGLTDSEAERVVRIKSEKANRSKMQPGTIKAEKHENGVAELLIYDAIGFDFWTGGGMTPKRLVDELEALKPFDSIMLRINSPGGDVFDGMTIFNILRRQEAKVSVEIEGLAASAASYIAQIADPGELKISEAGTMMIHLASGGVLGNKHDMRELADVLDKIDNQIATIYANRSKRKVDTWLKAMDQETWYTGSEAVDAKLADSVISAKRAAACFDLGVFNYRNAPQVEPVADQPQDEPDEPTDIDPPTNSPAIATAVRLKLMELEG